MRKVLPSRLLDQAYRFPRLARRSQTRSEAGKGLKVLLEPFDAGFAVAGFYQTSDGAVVEFVTYKDGPSPWALTES